MKAGITDRLFTRMPSPARPAALALLGATSIAPMPVLVALAHDGPVPTAVYRCGLALPVLWAFAFAESRRRGPRAASNRARAFVAGLFLAVDMVLFNHTITDAGAGISTVIGSLYVPIVAVLGWALLRERPSGRYLATLPVVVGGIVLASGVIGGSGTGLHPGAGIAYGAAANVAYAGYLLTLRNAASDTSHVAGQLFDATAGATVGAVLFGLVFGGLQLAISWQALGWLVLLALVVQVAGWLLITASLPGLPAALSSLLLLLQPALALLLAGAAFNRWPTAIQLTGAAIACAGVLTAARSKPNTHVAGQITDPRDAASSPSPGVNYVHAAGGHSKNLGEGVESTRCLRGESERQRSGLPVSIEEPEMALYLIAFNDEWVPDLTLEQLRERATSAKTLIEEMTDAGVFVFSDGGLDASTAICSVDPSGGTPVFTDGPFVETKEHLGGFAVVDVPDDAAARYWAGRIAVAVGWPQEVHRFPHRIAVSTDPQSKPFS